MGNMMNDRVWAKTARGREEIAMRTHGVPSRLRALLLLVDGQRTEAMLASSLGNDAATAERLAQLAASGLIAVQAAPAPVPALPRPAPVAAPAPAAVPVVTPVSLHDIYASRR